MVSRAIREQRCEDVLAFFNENNRGLCFMTLTTPDVVDLFEIRKRWRSLRHFLQEREGDGFKYVMNYELHPKGHGWHIHAVFNRFINLRGEGLLKLRRYGFRMINVKPVTSLGVSLYLSKHCLKAYRGVRESLHKGAGAKRLRLVNTSRGLARLCDYRWRSAYFDSVQDFLKAPLCKEYLSKVPWKFRYLYAELAVLNGWSVARLCQEFNARRARLSRARREFKILNAGTLFGNLRC